MEKVLAKFNVVCVTKGDNTGSDTRWHKDITGEATVVETTVTGDFPSNPGFEHPLVGVASVTVRFNYQEYLLTRMTDGLGGSAVCLLVRPMGASSGEWHKLYTDTPTKSNVTPESIREDARRTSERASRRSPLGF